MNQLFEKLNANPYYAQLLNAVNDGIVYENLAGCIVFANNHYCRMAGRCLSELIGQPSVDFIYPADRDIFLNKTASRDHIKQESYSIRVQRRDGRILETVASVQAICDEQNAHIGNLAVLTDITELQHQKLILEESENKFKTLLKASNEAIFIHEQGVLLEANEQFYQMHGYEPSELLGKPLAHLLLMPESIKIAGEHFEAGNHSPIELTATHKDGTQFPVQARGRNIIYKGRPVRVISVLNLTGIKKRESELSEIQQRYDELAQHSGTFIWEVDANGLYTYVDRFIEQVAGYNSDEIIGKKHFYDIHPEKDRGRFKEMGLEVFQRKEKINSLENPIQAKNGEIIWVSTDGIPQLNADGSLRGYRGSDTDITHRKHIQQELEEYQLNLSHTERLAGLGTMVATMCHEINQPLTVLNLTLQELHHQLQKNNISKEIIIQHIQDCLSNVSNSMSILHQYRKSSRLNDPLESKSLSLTKLLETLRDVFRGQCQKNNVRIILAPSIHKMGSFRSECDLEQILFILIHNAIDASAAPNAHDIRINSEHKNRRLIISVSDQGPGIPDHHRDKIFDPFFTTKDRDDGTGLGLSIVKRILGNCGGEISFTNNPNHGCTFSVTIPTECTRRNSDNEQA